MPLVRNVKLENSKVTLVGISHIFTEHSKDLEEYIEKTKTELIALEGDEIDEQLCIHFFGKAGLEKVREENIPLTSLASRNFWEMGIPEYVKENMKMLARFSPFFSALFLAKDIHLPEFFIASFSLAFLNEVYGEIRKKSLPLLDSRIYWKYLNFLGRAIVEIGRVIPTTSKKEIEMAYGIKRLSEEGYTKILAVTGMAHTYPMEKLLKDKNLENKFMTEHENHEYEEKGLTVVEPWKFEKIDFVPYLDCSKY